MKNCLSCRYAEWLRTKGGRLHPSGDGRCTWTVAFLLPACKALDTHRLGFLNRPSFIDRRAPHNDCPAYIGEETLP